MLEIDLNIRYNVFIKKGYRIISVEAQDIYKNEQGNGVEVGVLLSEKRDENYFGWFRNYLDCEEYKLKLNQAQQTFCLAPKAEREVAYEKILELQAERDRLVSKYLTNPTVAALVIRYFEQKNVTDWRMYEPIISNPVYMEMISKSGITMPKVKENADGEYDLYGIKFTKIS